MCTYIVQSSYEELRILCNTTSFETVAKSDANGNDIGYHPSMDGDIRQPALEEYCNESDALVPIDIAS